MYLQITTKCNMHCAHCCYSCDMSGEHGDFYTIERALKFASEYDEMISIGGGEPTLHPDFFDILRLCLSYFDYVWLATNGSQTAIMHRLDSIMQGYDVEYDWYECTCETDEERENCECWLSGPEPLTLQREDQLTVALSQDRYHAPIDPQVVALWKRRKYEIRDVTKSNSGVIAQGRGKRVGSNKQDCVCGDILIAPDGTIKLCGCDNAPIIGNIWDGIKEEWQEVMFNNQAYLDTRCYNGMVNASLKQFCA